MVGGQVIETIVLPDKVWINCQEKVNGRLLRDKTAIYVKNTPAARAVSEGDIIWWQGPYAMWTPKSNGQTYAKSDMKLERIGCSGVNRPDV